MSGARPAAAPDRCRRRRRAGRGCAVRARGPRRAPRRRASSSQGTSSAVASSVSGKPARSAAGLRRPSSRCSATTASGAARSSLLSSDAIGRLDLRARLLVSRQLRPTRFGVDHADHARRDRRRGVAQPLQPVEDRPRLGDSGRLQQHHLRSRAARHLGDRRPQLGLHAHLVADAAARQLHHVAGAALDQAGVDVDAAELVDDDADPPVVLGAEHAVQDRGLAGAQKAGQQNERRPDGDIERGHGARL